VVRRGRDIFGEAMNLFAHQSAAIEIGKSRNQLLAHSCGTGKTLTGIEIKRYHGGQALVLCPISIMEDAWGNDIKKFSQFTYVNLHNDRKLINRNVDFYLCNYDLARSMFKELSEKCFSLLFVDESSKIKNHKSQITQLVMALSGFTLRGSRFKSDWIIPRRFCLSGTPAPNSEIEFYPQIKVATGPGNAAFNDNFYAFRNRYFRNIFQGKMTQAQKWLLRKTLDDGREGKVALMEAMAPYIHVVRKQDAIDLPEQIDQIRSVELSKPEQDAYDNMERDLVLQFGNEQVLAVNALSECMKLRQLTSGFCYGTETYQTGTSKLDALKEALEEIDGQVIIWCNFINEAKMIASIGDCDILTGQTVDRDSVVKGFQTGKFKYLIANPQSAGHGLTFVNCSYAVYFGLNYSYELFQQSRDRIHRIGQNNKCTYIYLLAKGTIDETLYKVLNEKGSVSESTLAWLRSKRTKATA
jgi:SNF2 family DNA or RNA helicase